MKTTQQKQRVQVQVGGLKSVWDQVWVQDQGAKAQVRVF